MPGETLSETVNADVVSHFVAHLKDIVSAAGVGADAFEKLVNDEAENRIQGRLYYNLSKGGETVQFKSNLRVDDALYADIEKLTKKGTGFDDYFNVVMNQFEKNGDFIKIITEFEQKHPGQGEVLKRALVAQAAYRMYEDVIRETSNNTKAMGAYIHDQTLREGVTKTIKSIEDKENRDPNDDARLETLKQKKEELNKNMNKLEPACQRESQKTNEKLKNGRIATRDFPKKAPEIKADLKTTTKARL